MSYKGEEWLPKDWKLSEQQKQLQEATSKTAETRNIIAMGGDVIGFGPKIEEYEDGEFPDGSGRNTRYFTVHGIGMGVDKEVWKVLDVYANDSLYDYFNEFKIEGLPDPNSDSDLKRIYTAFKSRVHDAWDSSAKELLAATSSVGYGLDDYAEIDEEGVIEWLHTTASNGDEAFDKLVELAKAINGNLPKLAVALAKAAQDMKQDMSSYVERGNKIAQDYKLDYIGEQSMQNEGGKSIIPAMRMLDALVGTGEQAKMKLVSATSAKAEGLIKEFVRLFDESVPVALDTEGMRQQDVDAVMSFVDNLRQISRRSFPSDIRSWQAKSVQRQDAILTLDNFIHTMAKALNHWTAMTPEQRAKASYAGLPNYKFGIGEDVKVISNNRHGKVIEYGKEQGNGKQYYKVRMTGVDHPKTFGRNELKKYNA